MRTTNFFLFKNMKNKLFLDLNYHFLKANSWNEINEKYHANIQYLNFIPKNTNILSIYRSDFSFEKITGQIKHKIFKNKPLFRFQIPIRIHQYIKNLKPDFVLIHGLGYALFAFVLKRFVVKNAKIMIQVHGFAPAPKGIKKAIFKLVDRYIDGYFFTGKGNATSWIDNQIFSKEKVFTCMEGSTNFSFNENITKKQNSYLWVGRLDSNKDPLTILEAFKIFLKTNPKATLTMIYNDTTLLDAVKSKINQSKMLKSNVTLVGEVLKENIKAYYDTHQFFVLGSHYEGSGYALLESMACGCIPIVTRIPSFEFMTDNGNCGLLFEVENIDDLVKRLNESVKISIELYRMKVLDYFELKLSYKAIAKDIYTAFTSLKS